MKKKFRKVVAAISATVMVLAMGVVSVNASDIQPRAMLCPNCGRAMGAAIENSSIWSYDGEVSCRHGKPKGTDTVYRSAVYHYSTCNSCGIQVLTQTTYRYKYECHGHN